MSHIHDITSSGHTTLSDRFDPVQFGPETPGGEVVRVRVSRDESQEHLLVGGAETYAVSDDASHLHRLIRSALDRAERTFGLCLITAEVTVDLRGPARTLELPRRPAQTLTKVSVMDEGTFSEQDLDTYWLEGSELVAATMVAGKGELVRVEYEAGFAFADMPEDGRQAIYQAVTTMYEQRSNVVVGQSMTALPESSTTLLRELSQTIR